MAEINLEPQTVDLVLYAGDGVTFRLLVKDKDAQAVPLIGTMKAQIRAKRSDTTPTVEFAVDLTESAQGIAILSLTGAQTQGLVTDRKFSGVWDVEWASTTDQPRTLCQGKVECDPDVSR